MRTRVEVAGPDHRVRVGLREVQTGRRGEVGLGVHHRRDLGEVRVPEAADVTERAEQGCPRGRRGEIVDSRLLQALNHRLDGELGVAVPVGEVLGAVDRRARAVHHAARVERVDLQRLGHPAEFGRLLRRRRIGAPGQPGRGGDVHGVAVGAVRVRGVVPRLGPGGAAVGGAEELGVRPPGAVRRRHDRARVLPVDGQAAEAVVGVRLRHRADVRPGARSRRVPPQLALAAVVGAALVAVRQIEVAVLRVQDALVGEVAGGLPGDPAPGRARVRRAVHRVVLVGDPDVDRPGGVARGAGGLVEGDPDDALVV